MTSSRKLPVAASIVGATLITWAAWMAWDSGYNYDPIMQSRSSSPFETWQIAGCVLSLAVIAAIGGWLVSPWIVMPAISIPFTTAVAVRAIPDSDGLFFAGVALILAYATVGSLTVSAVASALRPRARGGATVTAKP